MDNLKVLVFCTATLVVTLAVCVVAGRAVMVPQATAESATVPQPVEAFTQPIDVGSGLGPVSVNKLMEYFVAHPPHTDGGTGAPALPVQHFGGC
ncbi:MAG TPA: hypothetical protein VKA76_06180 [Gammaproteobacteria bacterium]|nr:hypothetical protein [Gammaproteobacteria bacterium]